MSTSSDIRDLHPLILQLTVVEQREAALLELSKKRETFPDLAPVLWYSFGTITALLQEMISIYPMLSPPTLSPHASNRVCNALALLQCVASHPETKTKLLNAHIPLYLYPFLNTVSRHRPFEYLRLTSLGVIGALVKVDDPDVINFLLQTEIIPLCLRIMEIGSELSKTVATFIVQKILLDDTGLQYICATAERFYAVSSVLSSMVSKLREAPSIRLLKHIVRCYLRLSEHLKARDALRQCLPDALRDNTFANVFRSEESVMRWYQQMLRNVSSNGNGPDGNNNGNNNNGNNNNGGGNPQMGMSGASLVPPHGPSMQQQQQQQLMQQLKQQQLQLQQLQGQQPAGNPIHMMPGGGDDKDDHKFGSLSMLPPGANMAFAMDSQGRQGDGWGMG